MNKPQVLTILDHEDFLRQTSKIVEKNDSDLINDIKILETYSKENDILAIASIQLGIPKRIVYLKNTNLDIIRKIQNNCETQTDTNYNEARILINPTITKQIGLTEYWEACASCLDNMGHVYRPYIIEVTYYTVNMNKKTAIFKGFESTVLSHEIDHLDGILHMDIADKILNMPQEERKIFRQTHDYNIISKTGNYKDLLKTTK